MMERRRIPIEQNGPAGENAADREMAARPQDEGNPVEPGADEAGRTTAGEDAGPVTMPAEGPSGSDGEPGEDQLAVLAAERDSFLDSLQRLKAEFENFRRRSQRERDESESRARGRLLVEFLPILDNLGRALDAAEHHEESQVLDGVRLTHSQFVSLLQKEGVTEICPLGEPFDPELHEAMLTQPSEQPEGIVTVVLERGYRMGDRVLRPARVAVSAGPGDGGPGAAGAAQG
jgi:molecular chaperone GrpE